MCWQKFCCANLRFFFCVHLLFSFDCLSKFFLIFFLSSGCWKTAWDANGVREGEQLKTWKSFHCCDNFFFSTNQEIIKQFLSHRLLSRLISFDKLFMILCRRKCWILSQRRIYRARSSAIGQRHEKLVIGITFCRGGQKPERLQFSDI